MGSCKNTRGDPCTPHQAYPNFGSGKIIVQCQNWETDIGIMHRTWKVSMCIFLFTRVCICIVLCNFITSVILCDHLHNHEIGLFHQSSLCYTTSLLLSKCIFYIYIKQFLVKYYVKFCHCKNCAFLLCICQQKVYHCLLNN